MIVLPPTGGLVRPADTDISDLTDSVRTDSPRWLEDGSLDIPLDPEPPPAEQARIRRRLLTRDAAHEAEVATMEDALDAIAGIAGPITDALRLLLRAHLNSTLGIAP